MINLKLINQTISAAVVTHCLFFLKGLLEMWLRLLTFSRKIFLGSNLGLLLFFYFHLIRILAENSNFHDYLRKDQRFISHKVPFSISPLPNPIKMAGNQHPSSLQEGPRFSFQSCHLSNGLRLH